MTWRGAGRKEMVRRMNQNESFRARDVLVFVQRNDGSHVSRREVVRILK